MASTPWRCTKSALSDADRTALLEEIRSSPFLAENPLNYRFADTRGFSVVVRRDGLDRLKRDFPRLGAVLPGLFKPWANAFYVNPLVIRNGAGVAPHCDLSLRSYCRFIDPPPPREVTVVYLEIPPAMLGGQLGFYRGLRHKLGEVVPETNLMIEFDGRLMHEVAAVETAPEGAERVSLVCEQYRLPWIFWRQIPRYRIQSAVPFAGFMREQLSGEDLAAWEEEMDV